MDILIFAASSASKSFGPKLTFDFKHSLPTQHYFTHVWSVLSAHRSVSATVCLVWRCSFASFLYKSSTEVAYRTKFVEQTSPNSSLKVSDLNPLIGKQQVASTNSVPK